MFSAFKLFILLTCIAAALAGDWQKRKYSFDAKNNELNIKAELSTNGDKADKDKKKDEGYVLPEVSVFGKSKDKLQWRLQTTSSGLKIFLKWMSKTEESKEKLKFNTYLKEVIEYDCRDCGGACCAYDPALDTAVTVRNDLGSWKNIAYVGCDGEGEDVTCAATFETSDGAFSVKAEINIAGLSEGDLDLSNNDLKLTVTESYQLASANPSALAILGKAESNVKSKSRVKEATAEGDLAQDDAVTLDENDEGVVATFSWLNDVVCGGSTRQVLSQTQEGQGEDSGVTSAKTVSWSILKSATDTECVWDPVVEFGDGRFCWECYALYFAIAFVALVACACSYFCCCRKKKQNEDTPYNAQTKFTSV